MFAATSFADQVVITGNNNQALDRLAIQNAINSAPDNRTIVLKGFFQLDGTTIDVNKSNITFLGAGKADGWSTVLKGLLKPDGTPQLDFGTPTFQEFNRAIKINNDASKIAIKGIKFIGFNRAIIIAPQINGSSSIGIPNNVTVSNNTIQSDKAPFPIVISNVINVKVIDNKVTAGPNGVGVITMRTDNGLVGNNVIDMSGVGFFGIAIDEAAHPVVFQNI